MKNWSRYIAIAFTILFIGVVFYYFSDIVAYVLVAWVLSMIGQPIMSFFKNYLKLGNAGSAALTLSTFIFLLTALIWVFVPPIVQQTRNLANIDYASLVKSLEEPINSLNNILVEKGLMEGDIIEKSIEEISEDSSELIIDTILTNVAEPIDTLGLDSKQIVEVDIPIEKEKTLSSTFITIDSILLANGDTVTKTNITLEIRIDNPTIDPTPPPVIDSTAVIKNTDTPIEKIQKRIFAAFNPAQIPALFSSIVGFMGNLMIAIMSILFIAFFFLKEQGLFSNFLEALVPSGSEKKVIHAVEESSTMLRRYFVGISIQVTVITIFMYLVLTFIGIKSAILIAFFAACINVIPYIGPLIGAVFGVFITISSNLDLAFYNEMLPLILMVLGAFAAMQMLDNFLLQPYIFSNSVSAHPLEIFIVILVGAKVGGILGMVLAIPAYTVIRVIAKSFLSEFKIVQRLTNSMNNGEV